MMDCGIFIINGIECVVVLQFVCFVGVFFIVEFIVGCNYYGVKIIFNCGVWLEFEMDSKHVLWVKLGLMIFWHKK
jgi:DNA-directed RNA polymerase beta subunit